MGRKSAVGSGIWDEQPGSYFLELRNHFVFLGRGVKILQFFDADLGSGMETVQIRDPGWKKVRSGINIPDPQHCFLNFKFLIVVGSRHFNFSLRKDIYFLVSRSERFLHFATNRKRVPGPCKRKVKNYLQLNEAELDPAKNSLVFVGS
jgi:hypothetical protein